VVRDEVSSSPGESVVLISWGKRHSKKSRGPSLLSLGKKAREEKGS